jgi:WXG100 family type VII secretion target
MSAPLIQAQYDDLEKIAERFAQQADLIEQMQQQVRQVTDALKNGGWQGQGSDAFQAEMEGEIFPAINRLSHALQEGSRSTSQIAEVIKAAEEEASTPFRNGDFVPVPSQFGGFGSSKGFSSDPPLPTPLDHDHGSGPYNSESALIEDRAFEAILWAGANKFELIDGHQDAADHMRHYLEGSGEPLVVNVSDMLQDLPDFQRDATNYRTKLEQTIAQEVLDNYGGKPMQFEVELPWQSTYATKGSSENWYYAMGGFSYTYTANVSVTPPTSPDGMPIVDVQYQLHVSDYYNWDQGKSVTIPNIQGTIPLINQEISIGVPSLGVYEEQGLIEQNVNNTIVRDAALARLHRTGLAQEFPITGHTDTSSIQFELDPNTGSMQALPPVQAIPAR